LDTALTIASGGAKAGVMSAIGGEDMGAAVRTNIDREPAIDILVDFAGIFPIPEGFRGWAVVLLVSFPSVFRAFRHAHNSPTR
jgi:hypothetical protein